MQGVKSTSDMFVIWNGHFDCWSNLLFSIVSKLFNVEFNNPWRHWTCKGKIILKRKNISLFSVGPSLRWDVYNVYNLANLKFLNSFRHEVGRRLYWGERISHSFQLDRAKGEMTSLQKWTMGERGLRRKDEHPFWTPPRKIRWDLCHIYFLILIFSSMQH